MVLPAFNAAEAIGGTLDALLLAVGRSGVAAEVIVVDDGSTDRTIQEARHALEGRLPFTLIAQRNRGRFVARRVGVEAAASDWVLLLDSRVRIEPEALEFVLGRLEPRARIWTSHVHVESGGHPLGLFWALIADLAWSDYFDDPRTVAFGADDFDRYPKGTTCFLAPRAVLLEAMADFTSRYRDLRAANDDTTVIRWMAEREPIHVSPGFSCRYEPRTDFRGFVRHATHRGVVFLDGHGRPESRFRAAVVAFYPASAAMAAWAGLRPRRLVAVWALLAIAAGGFGAAKGRSAAEVRALSLVAPLYAVAHGAGMWQGLLLIARRRCARS